MKLRVNNTEVPLLATVFRESLSNYVSTVDVDTTFPINVLKTVKLKSDKLDLTLVIVRVENLGSSYRHTCFTKESYDLLNKVCEPFTGMTTVRGLERKLGYPIISDSDSLSTFWSIPKCKTKTLIDNLNKYCKFPNGGGTKSYIDFEGNIRVIDLKSNYKNKGAIDVKVNGIQERIVTDWVIHTPGELNLTLFTPSGVKTKNIILEKGYGIGNRNEHISCEEAESLVEQELTNEFYRNYFKSRQMSVDLADPKATLETISPGTVVTINGLSTKFIVRGYTMSVTESQGRSQIQLDLVTCQES